MKNLKPFLTASFTSSIVWFICMGAFQKGMALFTDRPILLLSLIFWLFVLPFIAYWVATRFKTVNALGAALCGLIPSYGVIFLLTYKQLGTDLGQLMLISIAAHLVMIPLFWWMNQPKPGIRI